jgi:serpin B
VQEEVERATSQKQFTMAVDAMNAFTASLYARAAAIEGNFFSSPFSIHAALGMALLGAGGKTAIQMAKTLCQPPELHNLLLAQMIVGELFQAEYKAEELVIANALWAQTGMPLQPQFTNTDAGFVQQVDFAGETEKSRHIINDWTSRQTANRIRELIGPGGVTDLTRLILTNAVYFRADWREKFDPGLTVDLPFHRSDGTIADVPTMCQRADFRAIDDERFQAIHLWYEGFHLSMQVFVPRRAAQLPWLENTVLAAGPGKWQRDAKWRRVDLTLPRFHFETALSLGPLLNGMGIVDAFDPGAADFSGLTTGPFWLTDVIHKTYVDVNEEGTEAAGATAAILVGGVGVEYEPLVVRIDRPFMFTICGHAPFRQGTVLLFVGRVADPLQVT